MSQCGRQVNEEEEEEEAEEEEKVGGLGVDAKSKAGGVGRIAVYETISSTKLITVRAASNQSPSATPKGHYYRNVCR